MDPHAVEVLEFDKIRALLAESAASALGIAAAEALQPSDDPLLIRRWLGETSEVRELLDHHEDIPLGGLHDIGPLLHQARIGGVLTPPELRIVGQTLGCIERVHSFFADREGTPRLRDLAAQLVPMASLRGELERCITDDGELDDHASPELHRLRRQIRILSDRVETTLQKLLGTLGANPAVQEPLVTMRQGRYCIPIKSSHQGHFEGIIHDRSASGQTVFMEPAAVVRLNNELREAQLAERDEVDRILRELSGRVAAGAEALEEDLQVLGILDLARARGRLSLRLSAAEPILDESGRFELTDARHPLLIVGASPDHPVVPIDLELGGAFTTLLVTGPNTGGKTVALKTLGLLTIMAHAGLHLPAAPGSRVAFCRQVFADIGDEQSIEQSLSTFGSHMGQTVRILDQAKDGALVLLDEVGAGTDPTEGAALAEALLATLHERGCRVVATTHHGSLKAFAYDREGVENASVEFDARSLRPTYRLLTGIPGASHAFDIAARLGLDPEVLRRATELLPADHSEVASIITEMQATKRKMQTELRDAEREAAGASNQRRELERERKRLRELETELREEARREASELLEATQQEADRLLAELRRADREGKQTEQARQGLRRLRQTVNAPAPPSRTPAAKPAAPEREIRCGDRVEVAALGREATVLAVEKDRLEVQVGLLRMDVDLADVLLLAEAQPDPSKQRGSRHKLAGAMSVDPEIHLRGQTVDEALADLDRYLDHALLAGYDEVRVVHGKGTGTLRRAVHDYLKNHPHVERYEHPSDAQGGVGVTVAHFRTL